MLTGRDLSTILYDIGINPNCDVIFIGKDGKTHEVNGFMRIRKDGVALNILCESYDFGFDFKADPWPDELKKFLVEHDYLDEDGKD